MISLISEGTKNKRTKKLMRDCYSKKHIFGKVALFKFEFAHAKSERPLNQITTEMWVCKFREDGTENQGN